MDVFKYLEIEIGKIIEEAFKEKEFPRIIDLHGLSVQQGYNKTLMFLKVNKNLGRKSVRIITGRSGKMNKEFINWIKNPSFKNIVDIAYNDYHKGSFLVRINHTGGNK